MSVNLRIQQLRKEYNITQQRLCNAICIDQSLYSKYERGERAVPVELIIKIAKFYDVTVDYILCLSQKKESAQT